MEIKYFRLAKINLIWDKAQKVFVKRIKSLVHLSITISNTEAEFKLKSLYSERKKIEILLN